MSTFYILHCKWRTRGIKTQADLPKIKKKTTKCWDSSRFTPIILSAICPFLLSPPGWDNTFYALHKLFQYECTNSTYLWLWSIIVFKISPSQDTSSLLCLSSPFMYSVAYSSTALCLLPCAGRKYYFSWMDRPVINSFNESYDMFAMVENYLPALGFTLKIRTVNRVRLNFF